MKTKNKAMTLTHKEKISLLMDAVLTSLFILLVNFLVFYVIEVYYATHPDWQHELIHIGHSILAGNNEQLWNWSNVFIVTIAALDMFFLYIRLYMHYRHIQQQRIIAELYYIADGHFDHQIPYRFQGDERKIVDSINILVENVIHSMSEELKMKRSKDELISNVSHDIRTPLTSIIGYLGLIENHQFNSTDDLYKYVHIAYFKAKQMKDLADSLFEYTKLTESNRKPSQVRKVEMQSMLDQLSAEYDLLANEHEMKLHTTTNFTHLEIEANPDELARAIGNLLTNALKYGKDGENLYLEGKQINPKELVIKVANDGEKIPEASLDHVFDRFYRVENSRNKSTSGTGLGLAIVNEIVKLHGGYCEVSSNDKLTTFSLHLPIQQENKLIPAQGKH